MNDLQSGGNVVSWESGDGRQSVTLQAEVANALALRYGGVAVIAGNDWNAQAILFNADGSVRAELKNPYRPEEGMAFYYFNYVGSDLVVVLAGTTRDFACRVDEMTGVLSPPSETR